MDVFRIVGLGFVDRLGNDKNLLTEGWDHRNGPFLSDLEAVGITPEDVDFVLCTHLHTDHVGWNTRLENGRWVPTFPKAKYLFTEIEWETTQAYHQTNPLDHYVDSVLPVMEAGQAQLVRTDFALDDEVRLEPSPGHTMGHVCVHLSSQGQQALITGDFIHSPVQCLEPEWIMRADADSEMAGKTRRRLLERCCENKLVVCATHFPEPSFGHVMIRGDAFDFEFLKPEN